MANEGGAETLDSMDPDVFHKLRYMTGGIGPDACIDAVGMEAHGPHLDYVYDKVKTMTFMATDRAQRAAPSDPLRAARAAPCQSRACTAGSSTSSPSAPR